MSHHDFDGDLSDIGVDTRVSVVVVIGDSIAAAAAVVVVVDIVMCDRFAYI